MSTVDPLVEDYLRRLDVAATSLPPERRIDLLDEIGEHIAVARASGAAEDEAALRNVLERLGAPEDIVAAAHEDDAPAGWGAAPRAYIGGGAPLVPQPRGTGLELAAVLLLTAGSFVPFVGWLVGVVLLWTSSLWRVREKLLGTLVVPFGPAVALYGAPLLLGSAGGFETCTTTDDGVTSCEITGGTVPVALPWALVLGVVVAPVVVAVVLLRIARRRAAQAPPTMVPAYGTGPSPWGPLEISAVLLLGLGGFLVPVLGALVGLVLACVSRRWTVRDKLVAGALTLSPAVLLGLTFVLPGAGLPIFPGVLGVGLLLLAACPVAAAYLAVVLFRRTPAPPAPAGSPSP